MPKKHLYLLLFFITACTVGPDYKEPHIYKDEQIKQSLKLNTKSSIAKGKNHT